MKIDDLIREIVREEIRAAQRPAASRPHSQLTADLPAGAGRPKYLRAWRRGRDAGDPEVWSEGRARLMTAAAWTRLARTEATTKQAPEGRPKLALVAPRPKNIDDDLLAELGGRRTGSR